MWHPEAARFPYGTPSVGVVEDGAAGSFSDKTMLIYSWKCISYYRSVHQRGNIRIVTSQGRGTCYV